jgi:hypothetical protein
MKKKIFFILLGLGFFLTTAHSAENPALLKVAYVNNFTQFIEWPENTATSDFKITVVGSKKIYTAFSQLSQETTIQSKHISVTYSDEIPSENVQLLFISTDDYSKKQKNDLKLGLQKIKNNKTLIITDWENGTLYGSHINFFETTDHYLRFEINSTTLKPSGITISSRLLKVAKIIKETL